MNALLLYRIPALSAIPRLATAQPPSALPASAPASLCLWENMVPDEYAFSTNHSHPGARSPGSIHWCYREIVRDPPPAATEPVIYSIKDTVGRRLQRGILGLLHAE